MQCARLNRPHDFRVQIATLAMTFLATIVLSLALAVPVIAATLDRVRETGKLVLGYRTDGRPFSYKDESGNAAGYAVALCNEVAEQVKSELGLPTLTVEWVPVTIEDQFQAVKENKVDLLCGAAETLNKPKGCRFLGSDFSGWNRRTSACKRSRRVKGGSVRPSTVRASVAWLSCTDHRETEALGSRGAQREVAER